MTAYQRNKKKSSLGSSCQKRIISNPRGNVEFVLIRSRRRRTMQMVVTPAGEVRVSVPFFVSQKQVDSFIEEKYHWIKLKQIEVGKNQVEEEKKKFKQDNQFLFLGKKYPLIVEEADIKQVRISFDGQQWIFKIPYKTSDVKSQDLIKKKLFSWYKDQAKEVVGGRIFYFSRQMNLEPKEIVIKTQKRMWGNCSYHSKVIRINWQIILSPLEIIDYIVVHELSHLEIPNHSKKFWSKVGEFLPDYKIRQKWLKDNTHAMMLL